MALCTLAPSLASDDVAAVRASLDKGHTLKAARRAEKALETADPAAATELRYLRFRAYVMDLEQGNGDLVKKTVGEVNPDAMERYDAILDSLESKVRADGADALPVVVGALVEGDALDRLLSLGLLQTMRREEATLPWSRPLDPWGISPVEAALAAVQASAADCVEREAVTEREPDILDAQLEYDRYHRALYALEPGLDFLSRVDPGAGGEALAGALECRGVATWVLEDRDLLARIGSQLAAPMRRTLEETARTEVRVEALQLLGRHGECSDLSVVKRYAQDDEKSVRNAAGAAAQALRSRNGCGG